jgi:hypothetical protein
MVTTTVDLTPAEIRKAGWEALISHLGVAKSLRFLLEYEKGQGNYTELRKELFAGQTVGQILEDMAEEGIALRATPASTRQTGESRDANAPEGNSAV